MVFEDVGYLEEKIALFLILKAVLSAKAQFLGDAGDAEWLARKAGAEYVVRRNVRNGHLVDVPVRFLPEIRLVGDLGMFVPIGREHTFSTGTFKSDAKAADAAKKVDKPMRGGWSGPVGAIARRSLA